MPSVANLKLQMERSPNSVGDRAQENKEAAIPVGLRTAGRKVSQREKKFALLPSGAFFHVSRIVGTLFLTSDMPRRTAPSGGHSCAYSDNAHL